MSVAFPSATSSGPGTPLIPYLLSFSSKKNPKKTKKKSNTKVLSSKEKKMRALPHHNNNNDKTSPLHLTFIHFPRGGETREAGGTKERKGERPPTAPVRVDVGGRRAWGGERASDPPADAQTPKPSTLLKKHGAPVAIARHACSPMTTSMAALKAANPAHP